MTPEKREKIVDAMHQRAEDNGYKYLYDIDGNGTGVIAYVSFEHTFSPRRIANWGESEKLAKDFEAAQQNPQYIFERCFPYTQKIFSVKYEAFQYFWEKRTNHLPYGFSVRAKRSDTGQYDQLTSAAYHKVKDEMAPHIERLVEEHGPELIKQGMIRRIQQLEESTQDVEEKIKTVRDFLEEQKVALGLSIQNEKRLQTSTTEIKADEHGQLEMF